MKTTLITGATGGLGKAFAEIFAENNCNLLLVGTNDDKLNGLKEELSSKYKVNIDYVSADFSDKEQLKKVYEYAKSKDYFVNNLVNCAGFGDRTDFKDMDADLQLKMIDVKL